MSVVNVCVVGVGCVALGGCGTGSRGVSDVVLIGNAGSSGSGDGGVGGGLIAFVTFSRFLPEMSS